MSTFNESNTIQDMLAETAGCNGWIVCDKGMLDLIEGNSMGLPLGTRLLKKALLMLNKDKGLTESQADNIIREIQGVYLGLVNPNDLVEANKRLRERIFTYNSFPCGPENQPTAIDFFNMAHPQSNLCYCVREMSYPMRGAAVSNMKRFDLVFYINGFPMVMCETKSPVRPSVDWAVAAGDILDYEKSVPHAFVANVFNIATEGKKLRYGGLSAPLDKWGPWFCDCLRQEGTLDDVRHSFMSLVTPAVILDMYRNFTLYKPNKKGTGLIKIVARYQQFEGANAIVKRTLEGKVKKGLIWHFQGSGKSLLMVFAAQKLRMMPELGSPTVAIVLDRIDLDTQITATFNAADVPNLVKAQEMEKQMGEPLTMETIQALAEQALKEIPPRVKYYADMLGVTYGRITVRNQTTKWGSCTAKGNLNFNCLLMLAPREVLDSVIVHELAHRKHMDHSKQFYEEVLKVFPDYHKWDKWLKDNGGILINRMKRGLS